MANFEAGREALDALVTAPDLSEPDRNEAQTRFDLIDRIFRDVLGWPGEDIRVERHEESGYTDYEFGHPPALVVEAKREGQTFALPAGWSLDLVSLTTLLKQSKDTESAIRQTVLYANQRGIRCGAICNGHQLVAFVASRQDGVPPLQGKAFVFWSLEEMRRRFSQLWDLLSPDGIASGALCRAVGASSYVVAPDKLSSRVVQYPGYKRRNPLATELQILGGIFLEDISKEPSLEDEFLRSTYCTSGALSQYALVSKEVLQSRYSQAFEEEMQATAEPATTKKGLSKSLGRDIVSAGIRKRPILLVGDVGVGKTMFIRHLVKVEARQELERAFVIYIDLGSKPTVASSLRSYVADEVVRQLDAEGLDVFDDRFVRGVYHGELLKFGRSIYGKLKKTDPKQYDQKELEFLERRTKDTGEHLKACLHHLVRGEMRSIVLFLDNVDQRPSPFQEESFLIASSIADQWPVTTFVALRPETVAKSKTKGYLAAYQPRVFTIDPPRVDLVLQRRLTFALSQLEQQGSAMTLTSHVSVEAKTLVQYMSMLSRAFNENQGIIEFVDNMSSGNIRTALGFVSAFVGSGHVDALRILKAESEQIKGYILPLHEFLRAVMFGDNEYFDPTRSPVLNVFDIALSDGREHFLTLSLIGYVERAGRLGGSRGYVPKRDIAGFAQQAGFSVETTDKCLERCLEGRLIAQPAKLLNDDSSQYRVTTAGAYTAKKLVTLFSYIDAVIIDTPIVSPAVRSTIVDVNTIDERLDRAQAFLDYLDGEWTRVADVTREILDWPAHCGEARSAIDRIRSRTSSGSR